MLIDIWNKGDDIIVFQDGKTIQFNNLAEVEMYFKELQDSVTKACGYALVAFNAGAKSKDKNSYHAKDISGIVHAINPCNSSCTLCGKDWFNDEYDWVIVKNETINCPICIAAIKELKGIKYE